MEDRGPAPLRGPRRPRLAAAAARRAAAPDRLEPAPNLAATGGARAGVARPGRLPPLGGWPQAPADGRDHRYAKRADRPAAWPTRVDAHKKIKGRKRVLMIDTQGDPLGVRVVSADVQDRDALHALALDLDRSPSLVLVWLDRAFAGDDPAAFLGAHGIIPSWSAPPAARGSRSSRGAGRSSRPSAACSATVASASTTRPTTTPRAR